jgi:hypothetical protein
MAARGSRCIRAAGKAALPCPDQGNMTMATAGRTHCAAGFLESRMTPSRASCRFSSWPLAALARKLIAVSAISCAMGLAGCASKSTAPELEANHIEAAADRQPEPRIRRPNRSLLTQQRAPDCEFREMSDLEPVDPDQWLRLKLAYERQCYQHAEQMVRKRLRRLQTASTCEIEPVQHSLPTGR